jgi:site-specific DNA-cytosine methylase
VFIEYVVSLRPPVFLLENVQGILWTPKGGRSAASLSVVDHLAQRMVAAGYEIFPKVMDAVWYGVPQYRSRFFVLGIHKDLGYRPADFGVWGPYPIPTHGPGCSREYVTVRDAISDLPHIGNGDLTEQRPYEEPAPKVYRSNEFLEFVRLGATRSVIDDHVTSRHADYVIQRYRRIPAGGNWEDIVDALTNYADVKRTHSNIYRRLRWNEPSITIGHYRKSMLVHPTQHRGLSLREACRLQSFPDWFRFCGGTASAKGGLVHKQQQLANAVCPLVTKALAEFILRL